MTYEEAMDAAKSGTKVLLPHFHECWVRYDRGRGVHVLENEAGAKHLYRSTASERKATEWVETRRFSR